MVWLPDGKKLEICFFIMLLVSTQYTNVTDSKMDGHAVFVRLFKLSVCILTFCYYLWRIKMFKTRMIGLPYGKKKYDNMLSRFHLIPEQTDG